MFGELMNISKHDESTASVGSLCQCSVPLRVKSEHSKGTSSALVCAHCLQSCHRALFKRAWLHHLYILHTNFYTCWWNPPYLDTVVQVRLYQCWAEGSNLLPQAAYNTVKAAKPGIRDLCHKGTFLAHGPALNTPCPAAQHTLVPGGYYSPAAGLWTFPHKAEKSFLVILVPI